VERPAGLDAGVTSAEGIGPEDTFDGDYGRLLDRAYEKRVKVGTSPTGVVPEWSRAILGEVPAAGDAEKAA
jgi:hypothetical protein